MFAILSKFGGNFFDVDTILLNEKSF